MDKTYNCICFIGFSFSSIWYRKAGWLLWSKIIKTWLSESSASCYQNWLSNNFVFCYFFRRNSSQNISKQKHIPSVDKLVQESAKENRDILNVCHSKKDSIYDTIEDEEGYLKSFPVRKICNLPYTKSPTSLVPSKEEDENISNAYLYILE